MHLSPIQKDIDLNKGTPPFINHLQIVLLPFEYNNGNIPYTNSTPLNSEKEFLYMKATGIVRRIDDLGRVVIPKEIRRTMRIREGDPSLTTLTPFDKFIYAMTKLAERLNIT